MNSRHLLAAVAAVATLSASAASFAGIALPFVPSDHDVRPWEAGPAATTSGMGELQGRAALTGNNRLIVVEPKAALQTFVVGSTRFFDSRGKAIPSESLHEGDEVKVDYDLRGNTAIARRVTILRHPAAEP